MTETQSVEMVALEGLAPQFEKLGLVDKDVMVKAIDSMVGIALVAKDKETKIKAVSLLGDYAGLQPDESETREHILTPQRLARQQICGIALVSCNPDIDTASINALEKSEQ